MHKILITGGTGLVGTRLSWHLQNAGHQVVHLSHSPSKEKMYTTYYWQPSTNYIDPEALAGVDTIIHLAGANVGARKWSKTVKHQILESRTATGACLLSALQNQHHSVKQIICASASGYYPQTTENTIFTEADKPGTGFLTDVVLAWEKAAHAFSSISIHTAIVRIGVVLSSQGGALPKLMQPIKYQVGAPLGKGTQLLPWIHIDDLCSALIWIMTYNLSGVFNLAAPNPVSNADATYQLAKLLGKKIYLPHVPSFLIEWLFGEMSVLVLKGCGISPARLMSSGFRFNYTDFKQAVEHLITHSV